MASRPIFTQIELHKALRDRTNSVPEPERHNPEYIAALDAEEHAHRALAGIAPKSLAEAAALLKHMADTEADLFLTDSASPFLRTVYSVANALTAMAG